MVKCNCEQTKSEKANGKIRGSVLGYGLLPTSTEIPVEFSDSLASWVLF